jgi:hypothetical protein
MEKKQKDKLHISSNPNFDKGLSQKPCPEAPPFKALDREAVLPEVTASSINAYRSRGFIFTISATLTAMAIGASLFALVIPSCDEGSLNVKLWAFEYQLTKKGSCSTPHK